MESVTLEINRRQELGSAASKRYRQAGLLPSVVYTGGERAIPGLLNYREFSRLAHQTRSSRPIVLKSEDNLLNGKFVIVKEIQHDHLKGLVKHVDFQILREDEDVQIHVPLKFVGVATGVKNEGGILTVSSRWLEVSCLPQHIPELLELDVSGLGVGHSLHAVNVILPEHVKLSSSPELTIVGVVSSKKARMEEVSEVAVAAEVVEGEVAAAGAEGAEGAEAGKVVEEKEKDKGKEKVKGKSE